MPALRAPEMVKQCRFCGSDFMQPKGHPKMYCSRACKFKIINAKRKAYSEQWSKNNYAKNVILLKAKQREWYNANKEYVRMVGLAKYWHMGGRESQFAQRRGNREYLDRVGARIKSRRQTDLHYRLKLRVCGSVRSGLRSRSGKRSGSVWSSLPYTPADLRAHLESFFSPANGFTWENYGKAWHIDHVIPQSRFRFMTLDDPEFLNCWRLENLIPQSTHDNLRKSCIRIGSFMDNGQMIFYA